jgi:Repeat of unknown function (DUF5648)
MEITLRYSYALLHAILVFCLYSFEAEAQPRLTSVGSIRSTANLNEKLPYDWIVANDAAILIGQTAKLNSSEVGVRREEIALTIFNKAGAEVAANAVDVIGSGVLYQGSDAGISWLRFVRGEISPRLILAQTQATRLTSADAKIISKISTPSGDYAGVLSKNTSGTPNFNTLNRFDLLRNDGSGWRVIASLAPDSLSTSSASIVFYDTPTVFAMREPTSAYPTFTILGSSRLAQIVVNATQPPTVRELTLTTPRGESAKALAGASIEGRNQSGFVAVVARAPNCSVFSGGQSTISEHCTGLWRVDAVGASFVKGGGESGCAAVGFVPPSDANQSFFGSGEYFRSAGAGAIAFACLPAQGTSAISFLADFWTYDGVTTKQVSGLTTLPIRYPAQGFPGVGYEVGGYTYLDDAASAAGSVYFAISGALWEARGNTLPAIRHADLVIGGSNRSEYSPNPGKVLNAIEDAIVYGSCSGPVSCSLVVRSGDKRTTLAKDSIPKFAFSAFGRLYVLTSDKLLRIDTSRLKSDQPENIPSLPKATEFYNASLDRYFVTADEAEAEMLANTQTTGETPTGKAFYVLPERIRVESPTLNFSSPIEVGKSVCRFYGSVQPGPNSHFFSIDDSECEQLKSLQASTPSTKPRWNFEGLAFFARTPSGLGTAQLPYDCGTKALYRSYNRGNERGRDSNHRFTTDKVEHEKMIAKGWKDEGIVMCVE